MRFVCALILAVVSLSLCGRGSASTPSESAWVAAGARIGRIHIDNKDIFDLSEAAEDRPLYRIANRLHRVSREQLIRELLLFKEGDRYQPRLLAESERLLRGRKQFHEAKISVTAEHNGLLDVHVMTWDAWSLQPEISFGRSGGDNQYSVGLNETNLLGTGHEISLSRFNSKDRDGTQFEWRMPERGQARWRGQLRLEDNSDGHRVLIDAGRPFYALDVPWMFHLGIDSNTFDQYRYRLGERDGGFSVDADTMDLSFGRAFDWHQATPFKTKALRWSAGVGIDRATFTPLSNASPTHAVDGQERDFVYPYLGLEFSEDKFVQVHNRDLMGKTEDLQTGWWARAWLGHDVSDGNHGGSVWLYQLDLRRTYFINERSSFGLEIGSLGRYQDQALRNAKHIAQARFDYRWNDITATHISHRRESGHRMDPDHVFYLGGDNGLRGYPKRYADGDQLSLSTIEQRFYTAWYPWRLFRVGGAVFFDAGTNRFRDGNGHVRETLRDVGLGLRLFNTRSSVSQVIHIDLAMPLDGDESIDELQLLVRTDTAF